MEMERRFYSATKPHSNGTSVLPFGGMHSAKPNPSVSCEYPRHAHGRTKLVGVGPELPLAASGRGVVAGVGRVGGPVVLRDLSPHPPLPPGRDRAGDCAGVRPVDRVFEGPLSTVDWGRPQLL